MSLVDLGKRLLHASRSGDVEEVRVLMANGAPFTTDWLGTSPLHYAANHGHIPTAEVLLRAGISRDARTKVDRTPLHIACQEGHAEIAELLLKHGADADAKDMLKMSPLHWAVERGHDDCVHALLKHGADPNHEDKFDRTALQIALATQNMEVAQSLELVTATKPTERISEYIGVDDITEAVDVINEVEAETENTITVSASSLQKTGARFRIKNKMNPSTTVKSSRQPSSTAVLATLAALAEATAPLNTTSTSSSVSSASSGLSTTDTLNWLQTHGITMVTDDGALVNSAMEGGDTLTLTEAGKLALNFVKQKVSRKEIKKKKVPTATLR